MARPGGVVPDFHGSVAVALATDQCSGVWQYPGGLRQKTLRQVLEGKFPERALEHAVRGMVMHNRLGADIMHHLKIYAGPTHPHQAQAPVPFELKQVAQ